MNKNRVEYHCSLIKFHAQCHIPEYKNLRNDCCENFVYICEALNGLYGDTHVWPQVSCTSFWISMAEKFCNSS
jgi:hypothetical protein